MILMGSLAGSIRDFVCERILKPKFQEGEKEVALRVGDIAKAMNLSNRVPAICSALRSRKMVEVIKERLGINVEVKEVRRDNVKKDSSTNVFIFKIIKRDVDVRNNRLLDATTLTQRLPALSSEWIYEKEWFEETNVARKIRDYLVSSGWRILKFNEDKRQRGPDIIAEKEEKKIIIEVKGYPSDKYVKGVKKGLKKPTPPNLQARHWFAEALLAAIRSKYREPRSIIAIGLPKIRIYEKLVEEIRAVLRDYITLQFILVSANGKVEWLTYND